MLDHNTISYICSYLHLSDLINLSSTDKYIHGIVNPIIAHFRKEREQYFKYADEELKKWSNELTNGLSLEYIYDHIKYPLLLFIYVEEKEEIVKNWLLYLTDKELLDVLYWIGDKLLWDLNFILHFQLAQIPITHLQQAKVRAKYLGIVYGKHTMDERRQMIKNIK